MPIIYVATTGNDTTGDGSAGNPYATITKLISVLVAGDVGYVAAGIYDENTSALGYLLVNKSFASRTVITLDPASRTGEYVIRGTGTAFSAIFANCVNLVFHRAVFESRVDTVNPTVRLNVGAQTGLRLERCTFRVRSHATQANTCVTTAWTTAANTTSIVLDDCLFEQIGHHGGVGGLSLDAQAGGASGIEVRSCRFRTSGFGLRAKGILGLIVSDADIDSWGDSGATAIQIGEDAATGQPTTAVLSRIRAGTRTGHAGVIGAGVTDCLLVDAAFWGGNNAAVGQGLVIKNASGVRAQRLFVQGGYYSSLYLKAATDCVITDSMFESAFPTARALYIEQNNENGSRAARNVVRRNTFRASAGECVYIAGSSGDAGGQVVDENVYITSGTATLGTVRGTAVTTLAAMRAAWAGYDVPTNDSTSQLGVAGMTFAGTRSVELPPVAYDAATSTWIAEVAAAGGTLVDAEKAAVDLFIRRLKMDGVWDLVYRLGLSVGDSLAAVSVPIKRTLGGAVDTFSNITSAHYSRATGVAFGFMRSIATGINPSTQLAVGNSFIGTYTKGVTDGYMFGASSISPDRFCLRIVGTTSSLRFYHSNGGGSINFGPSSASGLMASDRTGNALAGYLNGVSVVTGTAASGSFATFTDLTVGCPPNGPVDGYHRAYVVAQHLTGAQSLALSNALGALATALGW